MASATKRFLVLPCILNCDEDSLKDARELVLKLRPEWAPENVVEKAIPGGFLNKVHCFHLVSDKDLQQALVVRIFRELLGNLLNKNTEILAIQLASAAGCGGRLVAVFENGVVYPYLTGSHLEIKDFSDPNITRTLCRHLAAFHAQNPQSPWLWDSKGNPAMLPTECRFFDRVRSIIQRIPDKLDYPDQDPMFQQHLMTVDELENESSFLQSQIDDLGFELCVSHGDLTRRNIIRDEKTETISMIDFELSGVMYEGYDLAYLFTNTPVFDAVERQLYHGEPWSHIPDHIKEIALRSYVDHKHRLKNGPGSTPTETDHRLFKLQVEAIEVLVNFNSLSFVHYAAAALTTIKRSYHESLPLMKGFYFDGKKKIYDIKKEYLAIKHNF